MRLPRRELNQSETETYWIKDRAELVSCAERHAATVEFYAERDSRITGK